MNTTFVQEALGFKVECGKVVYSNGASRQATLAEESMFRLLTLPQSEWHGHDWAPDGNAGTLGH